MGKEESYSITYDPLFGRDLDQLDSFWEREVLIVIEDKLAVYPLVFGVPLRQTLKGFRKLRVGDYRIIYRVQKKTVYVVIVGHRSVVYKEVQKRLGL